MSSKKVLEERRASLKVFTLDFYREKVSWALHAWKNIVGETTIRNTILKDLCRLETNPKMLSKTFLGPTIVTHDKKEIFKRIDAALTRAHNLKKRHVFITFSEPALPNQPTHFIGLVFILDVPKLIIFDPARPLYGASAVYTAPFLDDIMAHYGNKGYKHSFYETSYTCQPSDRDVYCQTWVLLFLHYKLCSDEPVPVPRKKIDRLGLVLNFIKECIEVPAIARELRKEYRALTLQWEDYANDDPIRILQSALVDDMP
jgi:hypothetical protein